MNQGSAPPLRSTWVDLARTADFQLGVARIRPSLCEVSAGATTVRLQPRVMQVLVALARADGEAVSRDDLVESCWGGVVVGEDAINRCIGRLRRVSESEAPGSFSIETLARIGYRLNRSAGAPPDAPATARARRPRWLIAAAAVGLLALAGAAWLVLARSGPSSPADLIAILPFEIAGSDPSAHTFAENVADQVSGALVKSDLTVISPDTGALLDGPQRKAAAARLGAGFLLDGRVQGDGRTLQVNVHLDDLRQQGSLWSASFNRPVDQAQAMQEEVATKVAGVLHCALHVRDADGDRIDHQTLGLYLRACDVMQDSGAQDQAMDLLKQVVARQPRFAHAWSDLAVASELATDQLPPDRARQALTEARAAAERALKLDPKDGDAYVALSDMVPEPGHWAERDALLLKGLSLDPDNSTLEDREAGLLEDVGRLHEALEYAQRSFSLDPLSPDKATALAFVLAHNGRLDEARVVLEKAARTWPDNTSLWEARMSLEAREGDPDRALAMLDDSKSRPADWEAARVEPWRRLILARKSGAPMARDAFAREELAILRAGKTTGARAILMLNNVGRPDAAFEAVAWAAAKGVTEADPGPLFRPEADGMRRDPRFMPLAEKLGVVDFWRSSGKWPDFCEAPDLPYDCRAAAASLKAHR